MEERCHNILYPPSILGYFVSHLEICILRDCAFYHNNFMEYYMVDSLRGLASYTIYHSCRTESSRPSNQVHLKMH